MKIRKLVQASEVIPTDSPDSCSIAMQEDYTSAIDCIQCAIKVLSHAAHCDPTEVVAKESIANLAVVMLDLKSYLDCNKPDVPAAEPISDIIEEEEV